MGHLDTRYKEIHTYRAIPPRQIRTPSSTKTGCTNYASPTCQNALCHWKSWGRNSPSFFQQNGYNKNDTRQALHLKQKPKLSDEKPTSIAIIPYQKAITNKISRLLAKYNIKTFHIPRMKNIHAQDSQGWLRS
jgi:hypothetical protein